MTVTELINKLNKLPKNAKVVIQSIEYDEHLAENYLGRFDFKVLEYKDDSLVLLNCEDLLESIYLEDDPRY